MYDVCGAGDVFLSSLVYGFVKYGYIEKSIKLANMFASLSVSKVGTYILTADDIKNIAI